MPAFRRALELGASGIELDVHATRDGIVVVHHDPVVQPLDAGSGPTEVAIADVTWEELLRLRPPTSEGIPPLGDVLTLVGDRATVYVELKGAAIEEAVIATIRAGHAHCAVHSFDHAAIERASRIAPEIPRGLLFDSYTIDPARAMRATGARDVWPHWSLVDSRLVERVHEVGGRVIAWTVNDDADAAALLEIGVDAICTDDIRLVAAAPRAGAEPE